MPATPTIDFSDPGSVTAFLEQAPEPEVQRLAQEILDLAALMCAWYKERFPAEFTVWWAETKRT